MGSGVAIMDTYTLIRATAQDSFATENCPLITCQELTHTDHPPLPHCVLSSTATAVNPAATAVLPPAPRLSGQSPLSNVL